MAFFNDMDRLSLKLLSPSGLELFAKNIQEAFNNGHKYRKIEDCNGIVEYLKAIRDGEDGSKELFDKYIKVVDIEEKVTEKRCCNCINIGIWPSEEPCRSCITSEKIRPNWKSKEDTSEQTKKNINDIFRVSDIKHISDRVDSIQANVLEYGNNCISKLIKLEEKVGFSPDADIYLKDIRQDLCDLDIKLDCIDSILKDIQASLNEIKGHEKPKPKFKVGDTVKYKTGSINYFVINVKKLNTGYCYDLERRFPNCNKRNYKITGVLESRLEEVK